MRGQVLDLGLGITAELIEQPARTFTESEKIALFPELVEATRDGFGTDIDESQIRTNALNVDLIYLVRDGNTLVGFSSYSRLDLGSKVLFANGMVFREEYQSKGLLSKIRSHALSHGDYDFLVFRTQSPVVHAANRKLVGAIYPETDTEIPEEIRELATRVASEHLNMQDFSKETLVGRGTYGYKLNATVQRHIESDQLFDETLQLDYDAGDSVIVVGDLRTGS